MNTISVFVIALSLAMDAFGVSVSNGLLLYRVPLRVALKFGLFFGFFQFAMPLLGYMGGVTLGSSLMAIDNWVSLGLLGTIGGKMVYESFQQEEETNPLNPEDVTSFKRLALLAVATSIDAFAVGVAFAIEGINIWYAAAIIGFVAFILSTFGAFAGCRIALKPQIAERLGGFILIGIGIKIFLGA